MRTVFSPIPVLAFLCLATTGMFACGDDSPVCAAAGQLRVTIVDTAGDIVTDPNLVVEVTPQWAAEGEWEDCEAIDYQDREAWSCAGGTVRATLGARTATETRETPNMTCQNYFDLTVTLPSISMPEQ